MVALFPKLAIFFVCSTLSFAQVFSPETTMPPSVRLRVEPHYTQAAYDAGLTGWAILSVTVDRNGVPTDVHCHQWLGRNGDDPLGLDKAAEAAVRQWRFNPYISWGKPVSFRASIKLYFDFRQHPEQTPTIVRV